MNPDTVKTKADIKNVRKEYINNLRIQQSNIQLIENAIEAIDTTGDMILQPTDNRSTSQKNADIQQLKVDVRKQLLEIMDGENATKAVEDLARENNMLLVYLANTIEEVIAYFKPKYKNGVPAAVLVNYIKAQIRLRGGNERRTSQPFSQPGGGDDDDDDDDDNNNSRRPGFRPSSGGNESSAMNTDSDDSDDSDNDDNNGSNKKAKQNREEVVDEIEEPIITGNVDSNGKVRDDIPFSAGSQNIKTEKKPTNTKEKKVIGEKRGLVEEEEDRQIKRERQNEPERPQEQNKPSLRNIKKEKQNKRQKEKEAFDKNMKLRQMKKEQEREEEQAKKEKEANDDDNIVRVQKRKLLELERKRKKQRRNDDPTQDTFSDDEDERRILTKKRKAKKEAVGQDKKKKKSNNSYEPTVGEKRKLLELERKRKKQRVDDIENNVEEKEGSNKTQSAGGGSQNQREDIDEYLNNNPDFTMPGKKRKLKSYFGRITKDKSIEEIHEKIFGNKGQKEKEKSGKGFKGRDTSGGIRQNIMFGTGLQKSYEAPQVYLPFGRYKINIQRLEQDTLMLRSKKGGAIPDIPTQKVKRNIISILKKIVNNDMPNYDDINKLNDDDKELLYKIIELSHLANKINVPRPCNIDKENQTFEIMKGEIIAGNDNPDIIKKFKLLLVKLMNNKRIPRRQGQEILTDLITLGY